MVSYHSFLAATLGVLSLGLVGPGSARIVSSPQPLRQPASPGYRNRDAACPASCRVSGPSPGNWSVYHSLSQTRYCKKAVFQQFNIYDDVDDTSTSHRILACSGIGNNFLAMPNGSSTSSSADAPAVIANATYELGWLVDGQIAPSSSLSLIRLITNQIRAYVTSGYSPANASTVLFGQFGGVAGGVYIGKDLQSAAVGGFALGHLTDQLASASSSLAIAGGTLAMQLCGPAYDGDHTFGFMISTNNSYAATQLAMQTWKNGSCVSFGGNGRTVAGPAALTSPLMLTNQTSSGGTYSNTTATSGGGPVSARLKFRRAHVRGHAHGAHAAVHEAHDAVALAARAACRTIQVVSGDGCASLAAKCGITGAAFTTYNPGATFCSTLQPGQHVCCSTGTLPNYAPAPNPDGSCATYKVVADDTCSYLAAAHSLTVAKLETYNTKTWGWLGCSDLQVGLIVCLSTGTAPMPAADPNAICGPTVPGTVAPAAGVSLATLNPCPLNACCDIWGQCGTTTEFCVDTGTGAPGTAAPGTNGCISNCGTAIVQTPGGPFRSVGYYEGDSLGRACLYQDPSQVDVSAYTHLHYAFADMAADYTSVSVGDTLGQYEFETFKRMTDVKRVVTFGGWAFSTDASTYNIFRQGVTAANRLTMARTMANFVIANGLDGIDIDWEYPGAPDIPGIPPGNADDGTNYLDFLIVLKNLLPGKTVSIAAPASFWYLKGFPIREIGEVVDYVVFMTYDLHGQFDYGNQYAQDGCPTGNCLRSDVNLTETLNALSMVTKAGLPSNKVVVGITSYGRSFHMAVEGCYTAECQFTGSAAVSDAAAGPCTNTPGFLSDAEIKAIIAGTSESGGGGGGGNTVTTSYLDAGSNSNILVYNGNQWVCWMSADVRASRVAQYQGLGMGGATNWAIDLEDFNAPPAGSGSWPDFINNVLLGVDPVDPGSGSRTRPGNWSTLQCDNPAIPIDNGLTASQRWAELDCDDAWMYAVDVYNTVDKARGIKFTVSVANTLHGPTVGNDCSSPSLKSNCDQTLPCYLWSLENSTAGTFEVWNSLVIIHELYASYYEAIAAAAAVIIDPELALFEDTFAPVPPPRDEWLSILLGAVTLVGTVATSFFFNSYFSQMSYFIEHEQAAGNAKDTTLALVAFGVTLAQALTGDGGPDGWNVQDQETFSAYLGQVVYAWQNATEQALGDIFNGTSGSIALLSSVISDGRMIDGAAGTAPPNSGETETETNTQLEGVIAKALFAYAIPTVWQQSGIHPVVIISGYRCDDPIDDKSLPFVAVDVAQKSQVCFDNELFYLVYPKGSGTNFVDFQPCPGVDSLVNGAFGNLSAFDLVAGAVRTYQENGNQNGGAMVDPTDRGSLADLMNTDVTTPGYVRIPVCDDYTAFVATQNNHPSTPNYPCNDPVAPSTCDTSTFVDQTSDASPTVADCQQIIANIQHTNGQWEIENVVHEQHQIVQSGTCKFGVQGNGGGNAGFHVGAQDIVEIINSAIINYASSSGKVGAKGVMSCNGFDSRFVTVNWGLY
ncbi:Glycoside hydrolase, subgroup, catalytic core [Niveomyces insectorum RCEF 264]|uniref:chitinase n=1 Tax=Niveomyces insectorum RCEF 264 TaxID=1081102 RepID=A0A167WBC4_9HYPO|nr:Glycoside hydrolase, subgroup, catalytic core [Niveomyces insectorum RCEF 264]